MKHIFFLTSIIVVQSCFTMDQDYEVIRQENGIINKATQLDQEQKQTLANIQKSINTFDIRFKRLNEKYKKNEKKHKKSIIELQEKLSVLDKKINSLDGATCNITLVVEQLLKTIVNNKHEQEEACKAVFLILNKKTNDTDDNIIKINNGLNTLVNAMNKMQEQFNLLLPIVFNRFPVYHNHIRN